MAGVFGELVARARDELGSTNFSDRAPLGYAAAVFGTVGRRAVESVVGLFALLGFAFVPLGSKTGLEHSIALLNTPTAREAGSGLVTAFVKARTLLTQTLTHTATEALPLPVPSGGERRVRAVPPRLPRPSD